MKIDLPYKTLVENTNAISEKSDENQLIDNSSWPYCGYGEARSGFLEDSLKTITLKRVVILFYVWILEDSISVFTCITTSSITTRNRFGQLQVHTNSTYLSVIFWKWYVEVFP